MKRRYTDTADFPPPRFAGSKKQIERSLKRIGKNEAIEVMPAVPGGARGRGVVSCRLEQKQLSGPAPAQ